MLSSPLSMHEVMRCIYPYLGSRVEGLPVPLCAPAACFGLRWRCRNGNQVPISVAALAESIFNHAEMLTSSMSQVHSRLNCRNQLLRFSPLCSLQKMGLVEALLGFGCPHHSRHKRKAAFHNSCKVGQRAHGKPRCYDVKGGPCCAVAVSSALALSETC